MKKRVTDSVAFPPAGEVPAVVLPKVKITVETSVGSKRVMAGEVVECSEFDADHLCQIGKAERV